MKKYILGLLTGIIIVGSIGVVAYQMNANQITYEPKDKDWKVNTVKGAIDDINEKINAAKNNVPVSMFYAFGTPTSQSTTDYKTLNKKLFMGLYGTQKSICIIRNGLLNCFANNNSQVESQHLQQVFSDVSCKNETSNGRLRCNSTKDFICDIYSAGHVYCRDYVSDISCYLDSNGTISCQ